MLLQFPDRNRTVTALRQLARSRFHDRYRGPVIRRYGAETGDLGALVSQCAGCGAVEAVLKDLAYLPDDMPLADLHEALDAALAGPDWAVERCEDCGRLPDGVVAILGRFLPESGMDLRIEHPLGRGVGRTVLRAKGQDICRVIANEPIELLEEIGGPVSVRSLWQAFVSRHFEAPALAALDVQPGYCLAIRPYTQEPAVAEQMFAGVDAMLAERPGAWDVLSFLHDRDLDEIPVADEDSFHGWLAPFAHEISTGLVSPFVVVQTDAFVGAVADLAARRGLSCVRHPDTETLFCRIGRGEAMWDLNLGPALFKIIHEGLSFERGARRHLERPLNALMEATRLPAVLRTELPGAQLNVDLGGTFALVTLDGSRFAGDLVALATAYDFRTEEGVEALLGHLLRHNLSDG